MPNINWKKLNTKSESIEIAKTPTVRLSLDKNDYFHSYYKGRRYWQEAAHPFFSDICRLFAPTHIIDIGANYGGVAAIAGHYMKDARIVCIEPSQKLIEFIEYNLFSNSIRNFEVINAVASDKSDEKVEIRLHPISSADNRAAGGKDDWKVEYVTSISLKDVIEAQTNIKSIFIKIDTQGYEPKIFDINFMRSLRIPWICKLEFSPRHMEEAGLDPKAFLEDLVSHFSVCEFEDKNSFLYRLEDNLVKRLVPADIDSFMKYCVGLWRNNLGQVDLLIYNKNNITET